MRSLTSRVCLVLHVLSMLVVAAFADRPSMKLGLWEIFTLPSVFLLPLRGQKSRQWAELFGCLSPVSTP